MLNLRYILVIAILAVMAGWFCFLTRQRNTTIEVYTIPKEKSVALPQRETSQKHMAWRAPEHWIEQAPAGMRIGSFLINGEDGMPLEVSIIPLLGRGGGLTANVNRWRGQIGLPSLAEEETRRSVERITVNKTAVTIVDIKNSAVNPPAGILVAIIPHGQYEYFLKMTGPSNLIEKEKSHFRLFLETINFE